MRISIVTTLYKSSLYIQEFYERISSSAKKITNDYEIIFVNDGSPDDSLQQVCRIQQQDSRVIVVDLSRNFGHHKAIVAGLCQAQGERVFLIDIDLEEQPEWLSEFLDEMEESGADVVFGVQQERKGATFRRWSGTFFYRLFNSVSDTKIPENLCTVRLMSQYYVKSLTNLQDQNLFLAGNSAWIGFQQSALPIEKTMRHETSYSLRQKLKLCWDGVTSFSSYPLVLIFGVGLTICCGAGLLGSYYLIRWWFWAESTLSGYTSLILSIWFLGGLIILFLGLIGYYVGKVFNEVKGRPQYVVRNIYKRNEGK